MSNKSTTTYFLLVGFSEVQEVQNLYFVVFFITYLVSLMGNLIIITIIVINHHLHTPMYFFVLNLAVIDLGYISVTVPKAMALKKTRWILYSHCVAQTFSFVLFGASEFFLLTVMAYDRYAAICHPLHYETIMNRVACLQMAFFAWTFGLLTATLHTGATFASPFCSNIINQFFCDIPQLLKITCPDDMYLLEIGALILTGCLNFSCFLFIFISYVQIFKAVMKIPSVQGRQKAFSTCLPHIIVLSVFFFFGVFAYFQPVNRTPSKMDLLAAVAYGVIPPFLNPLIYSMRNKDLKSALWKLID